MKKTRSFIPVKYLQPSLPSVSMTHFGKEVSISIGEPFVI